MQGIYECNFTRSQLRPAACGGDCLRFALLPAVQEFRLKMQRGDGMGDRKQMDFFRLIDAQASENCSDAITLGPYL